ncbi:MAG TPA: hypothetical protein VG895_02030 [Patescibacteria group bacterium]|nr:hypothetical protein [Patescibacteria group bacterium]
MKKVLILLLSLIVYGLIVPARAFAIYNPTAVANNHFGIHVADTSDLQDVAKLVNSNGGDWGYVTFVIQKGERDPQRWQNVFDQMRRLHLIPIVRIATQPVGIGNNTWERPSVDEIGGWVTFLNSLNWVVKNRYVIVGNEPNHAEEWGGQIDPAGYADYLKEFASKLKESNPDFFIMAAGMDASATNTKTSMSEDLFLMQMINKDPDIFDNIDGLASHSYPNPNFSGDATATGKGTVATFDWELNELKFLGITKTLPVFITETGWTHDPNNLTTNLGTKYETAFNNVWNDPRIVAITPFIYKYVGSPFDNFSWVNSAGQFYDFYNNVLNLKKNAGKPIQIESADIITGILPKIAVAGTKYRGVFFIKNTGQSIWEENNLEAIDSRANKLNIISVYPNTLEPGQIGVFLINGQFANVSGNFNIGINFLDNGNVIADYTTQVNLIPGLPNLSDILNYLKLSVAEKLAKI